MKPRPSLRWFVVVLALGLTLVLVPGFSQAVGAATEDAALFYEELARYGEWLDYEHYGPVWRPTEVEESWRPYVNGRWVPTPRGYVFETSEPWGWAAYHYGNWMPTVVYGWVWVPGRTWYPHTVIWRSSDDYVGWAPILPPNYAPPPAYYPPGGYHAGMPVLDLIIAPFWVFVRAGHFLLGFGQPFLPVYTYYGCGCLAPPVYAAVCYQRTALITNYFVHPFFPQAVFVFGPPFPYVARVSGINLLVLNNFVNRVNLVSLTNAVPTAVILSRQVALKHIVPAPLAQGQPLPRLQAVENVTLVKANLGRPDVAPLPKEAPSLTAKIPKATQVAPPARRGTAGLGLPGKAVHPVTPRMQQEIKKLPAPGSAPPAAAGVKAPATIGVSPKLPVTQPAESPRPSQVRPQPEIIRGPAPVAKPTPKKEVPPPERRPQPQLPPPGVITGEKPAPAGQRELMPPGPQIDLKQQPARPAAPPPPQGPRPAETRKRPPWEEPQQQKPPPLLPQPRLHR